jgi:hypothetical protein
MHNVCMNQNGMTIGRGANQRVKGTPEQERARGERNARMAALRAAKAARRSA